MFSYNCNFILRNGSLRIFMEYRIKRIEGTSEKADRILLINVAIFKDRLWFNWRMEQQVHMKILKLAHGGQI